MKKVVSIVMNNFKNDTRVLKEAVTLNNNGFDVQVIALHDGISNLKEYDVVSGINIHRIILKSKKMPKSIFFLIVKYFEFLIKVIMQCKNVNIIHCNDLEPLPIAMLVKLLSFNKVKVVYDAHEYETEINGLTGIRKFFTKVMERILIKFVDKFITVNEAIEHEYQELYGLKETNVVLNVPNTVVALRNSNIFREKFSIPDTSKIFLYQGGLGNGRGIKVLLDAFAKLHDKDVCIVFMGYGILENLIKEYSKKYTNIFYHEAVAPQEVLNYTCSADYGISLIENVCLSYYYALPNKFFEYSMAGLPVICSDFPVMATFVDKYKSGICVESNDSQSIINGIQSIMQKDYFILSKNSRRMALENSWEIQERIIVRLYKDLSVE